MDSNHQIFQTLRNRSKQERDTLRKKGHLFIGGRSEHGNVLLNIFPYWNEQGFLTVNKHFTIDRGQIIRLGH